MIVAQSAVHADEGLPEARGPAQAHRAVDVQAVFHGTGRNFVQQRRAGGARSGQQAHVVAVQIIKTVGHGLH